MQFGHEKFKAPLDKQDRCIHLPTLEVPVSAFAFRTPAILNITSYEPGNLQANYMQTLKKPAPARRRASQGSAPAPELTAASGNLGLTTEIVWMHQDMGLFARIVDP